MSNFEVVEGRRFDPSPRTPDVRPVGAPVIRALLPGEEEDLFRFRYAIYVEEMGRKQAYADHDQRWIEEPLDARAFHLVAVQGGSIVGALRVNSGGDDAVSYYKDLYGLDLAGPWFPAQTSLTTKFMVESRLRRSPLAFRMCEAVFSWGYDCGFRFDFIDCNAHLRPFFSRLGYLQVKPDVVHPEYGVVCPLVLCLPDAEYFKDIGSPFWRLLAGRSPDEPAVAHFRSLVADARRAQGARDSRSVS